MKHDNYNGWTNYETWNAALWLDNDEGLCRDIAQEAYNNAESDRTFTRTENAQSAIGNHIRDIFEAQAEESPQSGWMADAINAYLREVDWYEIAGHYMEDIEKEQEEIA